MKMKWVKWSAEAVVSLRGAVAGSNLVGRTFPDFQAKTYVMLVGAHLPSKLGSPVKKKIFAFFFAFFGSNFAECQALGKAFAECPIKDTRQIRFCRQFFYRVSFAECNTRQSLCRVQIGLCRVF
jgi:hypothetical protein